jgi:hypothetical protein
MDNVLDQKREQHYGLLRRNTSGSTTKSQENNPVKKLNQEARAALSKEPSDMSSGSKQ